MSILKKTTDVFLAAVGIGALVAGIKKFRDSDSVPKPTKQDQVTRIDYLSGHYKQELERREREIARGRRWGTLSIGAGATLIAGGIYMLAQTLLSEERTQKESSQKEPASPPGVSAG